MAFKIVLHLDKNIFTWKVHIFFPFNFMFNVHYFHKHIQFYCTTIEIWFRNFSRKTSEDNQWRLFTSDRCCPLPGSSIIIHGRFLGKCVETCAWWSIHIKTKILLKINECGREPHKTWGGKWIKFKRSYIRKSTI